MFLSKILQSAIGPVRVDCVSGNNIRSSATAVLVRTWWYLRAGCGQKTRSTSGVVSGVFGRGGFLCTTGLEGEAICAGKISLLDKGNV